MYVSSDRHISRKSCLCAIGAALLLVAFASSHAIAQVTIRPLSDFTNAQQVTSEGAPSVYWTDPTTNRSMAIDYSGKVNGFLMAQGKSVGTIVSGTVIQRPLPNGTAEITVQLSLQNALVWAYQGSNLVFGHVPLAIINGYSPALATVNFNLKFTISAPGAPLADLATIIFTQHAQMFVQLNAIGQGPFLAAYGVPDGTPGIAQTTQTGIFQSQGNGGPRGDYFPAGHIDFQLTQ